MPPRMQGWFEGWHTDKNISISMIIAMLVLAVGGFQAWWKTQHQVEDAIDRLKSVSQELSISHERNDAIHDDVGALKINMQSMINSIEDLRAEVKQFREDEIQELKEKRGPQR